MGPNGPVTETSDMIKVAVDFYKDIFKKENNEGVVLEEGFWGEDELVTREESEQLEAPFTEEEVKKAVFSSYAEGAPGPDGLPFLFYQKFWDIVKGDLCRMFYALYEGKLELYRINFALVTLMPK